MTAERIALIILFVSNIVMFVCILFWRKMVNELTKTCDNLSKSNTELIDLGTEMIDVSYVAVSDIAEHTGEDRENDCGKITK